MGNKGAFVRFNGNDMVPHFTTFEVGCGMHCQDDECSWALYHTKTQPCKRLHIAAH